MKSVKLKPLPASSGPSPICSCGSCWDEPLLPKRSHIDIWLQSSINPIDNPTSVNVSYAHFAFCAAQVAPVMRTLRYEWCEKGILLLIQWWTTVRPRYPVIWLFSLFRLDCLLICYDSTFLRRGNKTVAIALSFHKMQQSRAPSACRGGRGRSRAPIVSVY